LKQIKTNIIKVLDTGTFSINLGLSNNEIAAMPAVSTYVKVLGRPYFRGSETEL